MAGWLVTVAIGGLGFPDCANARAGRNLNSNVKIIEVFENIYCAEIKIE
jgi:hypothetical protein